MEKLVYESTFQKIYFSEIDAIFSVEWENTAKMEDDSYRHELVEQVAVYKKYRGKGTLLNTSDFEFVISIETQGWTGCAIFPKASEAGIRHVAVVATKDFVSQVSIEINMQEDTQNLFVTQYFDDEQEALKWLKAQQ